jgi:hypothetical protein
MTVPHLIDSGIETFSRSMLDSLTIMEDSHTSDDGRIMRVSCERRGLGLAPATVFANTQDSPISE